MSNRIDNELSDLKVNASGDRLRFSFLNNTGQPPGLIHSGGGPANWFWKVFAQLLKYIKWGTVERRGGGGTNDVPSENANKPKFNIGSRLIYNFFRERPAKIQTRSRWTRLPPPQHMRDFERWIFGRMTRKYFLDYFQFGLVNIKR